MRIRIGRGFWSSRWGLRLLVTTGVLFLVFVVTFAYFWVHYSRIIDQRLGGDQVFTNNSRVFGAPPRLYVGQSMTGGELTAYLQRAGYQESEVPGSPGVYRATRSAVEIRPSAESMFDQRNAIRVEFAGKEVSAIRSLERNQSLVSAEIEPELLTNLFDSTREKRRVVRFEDLPKHVVDAVLSAEDKRFFEHPGFDPVRVFGAVWADIRTGSKAQGASTITMQVARSFFFSLERSGWAAWKRKAAETLVALQLEQRFTKEQIFELYANQIYVGNRGSFAIRGFGEGAQAYFGKDVRELSVGEAAFLAGIIRAPNRYASVERAPDRAAQARDRVLTQMVDNQQISEQQASAARKAPLHFSGAVRGPSGGPYFVDMVKDHLLERFSEEQLSQESFRIYSTLDPSLQAAAEQAVAIGMKEVDAALAKRIERWRKRNPNAPVPQAQVALVALDPRSGEIKALIGGRDYGQSQLNRALSLRQPGSAFKPFVFAAAFANAADNTEPRLTPASTVVDEPTTFYYEDKEYSPNNYSAEFHGTVTLRKALRHSLNNATVKIAEQVGFGRVVEIARQVGLSTRIRATPAVALGAYELTPIEVAAGYTVFATGGARAEPLFIRSVVSQENSQVEVNPPKVRSALDPRVAYLVTNLLQDVMNRGTAAGVRARGFTAPAGGKTGTSHDGWFAGFTSNLVCVVWVGFDDNRELGLSGSASAAPIWAEFMQRAVNIPGYRNTQEFAVPDGIVQVAIDPDTLELATDMCPVTETEVFFVGTEPVTSCSRHGGRILSQSVGWLARLFGGKKEEAATPLETPPAAAGTPAAATVSKKVAVPPNKSEPATADTGGEKKKGLLGRIFGIFGGSKKEKEKEKETAPKAAEKPKSSP